jgi:hypothetical protein
LDPHFGQPAVEAFTRGGAAGPVNIAYSGVYQWWYTIGLRTNEDLYTGALFLKVVGLPHNTMKMNSFSVEQEILIQKMPNLCLKPSQQEDAPSASCSKKEAKKRKL